MIRQLLLFALLLCVSPQLEAAVPGQMPALVLEQFVDGQWQSPNRVVAWGESVKHTPSAPPFSILNGSVEIVAGSGHTVALKSNGTVIAWGDNGYGQTTVPTGLSDVFAIAAGNFHTVALKSDGRVIAWGSNFRGQTEVPKGLADVVAIAAGGRHTVALKSNGTVIAWGDNSHGQTTVPTGLSDVVAIAAGDSHTVALKSDGRIVAWGDSYSGQSWLLPGGRNAVAIAAGYRFTMVLKEDGSVWIEQGYDGLNSRLEDLCDVVVIASGSSHAVALKNDGEVVVWGNNMRGQLDMPTGLTSIVAIAARDDHTVAMTSKVEMTVSTIGSSSDTALRFTNPSSTRTLTGLRLELPTSSEGQFSISSPFPSTLAPEESVQITVSYSPLTTSATQGMLRVFSVGSTLPLFTTTLRVGHAQVSLLDSSSQPISDECSTRVVAWGGNEYGQTNVPAGLSDVIAIKAGRKHTMALKSDGSVVAWGSNDEGQTSLPIGLNDVVAIEAGGGHSVALKSDGHVIAWGWDEFGAVIVPPSVSNIVAIAAGYGYTAALKSNGTVVAWGYNNLGQTIVPRGLNGVVAITAGGAHTAALKKDGTVVAWGANDVRQTTVPKGLNKVVAIAAGGGHTVAIRSDGEVVAWGYGYSRQTDVPSNLSGVIAIAAGGDHSVALKSDGGVVAWGGNDCDQTSLPEGLSGVVAIAAGRFHTVALVEAAKAFPSVQLGLQRDHTLFIKNTGEIALRGISIDIEGPDADQFSLPDLLPSSVAAGEKAPLTLRFSPTRLGEFNATIRIHSNAPDSPLILPIKGQGNYEITAQAYGEASDLTYSPLRIERQTGLVLQRIEFDNHTNYPMHGLRLVLSNVASGVKVFSSSPGKVPGTLEVLYTKVIAPKEDIAFDLVYHDPNRRATTFIQPEIKAQALEEAMPTPGPVNGTSVPLLRVQKLLQGWALEWNSKAGSVYVVEYSDDAGKTWFSAVHRLTSRGRRLFWIDRGQPETYSFPVVRVRTYRVKRLAAHDS